MPGQVGGDGLEALPASFLDLGRLFAVFRVQRFRAGQGSHPGGPAVGEIEDLGEFGDVCAATYGALRGY